MHTIDYLILVPLLGAILWACRSILRNKHSCNGNCNHCPGCGVRPR